VGLRRRADTEDAGVPDVERRQADPLGALAGHLCQAAVADVVNVANADENVRTTVVLLLVGLVAVRWPARGLPGVKHWESSSVRVLDVLGCLTAPQ
jgi:hypothetical protein